MRIVRLSVQNFRGIRSLKWDPPMGMTCLVGQGDSGKTTVLDAIELSLLPRNWTQFVDSDFFNGASDNPIEVEVTLVDVPDRLLTEEKFGLEQRGWSSDGELRDEPDDDDAPALTIRLRVDDSLDPEWQVINDRNSEGRVIGARDRAALGVVRLGDDARRQLSWVRGSSLARVTDSPDTIGAALGEAQRGAWRAVDELGFEELAETAAGAGGWGGRYGSYALLPLGVGLDPRNLNIGAGSLALRQANGISASSLGTGSRRLLGLAIQRQVTDGTVVMLVDEIENGLEPHRLRHVLSQLRESDQQVLLVSHSMVTVAELGVSGLGLVQREDDGNVTVRHADESLQSVVRTVPEAILGRRAVVCEGKTEYGIARGLVEHWDQLEQSPLATKGTAIVPGGGSHAPQISMALRSLGYGCIYWGDGDVTTNPSLAQLEAEGVETVVWGDSKNTEQRIMADVSGSLLEALWNIAVEERGLESVSDQLAAELGRSGPHPTSWSEWTNSHQLDELRLALGKAASTKGWYKNISVGRRVGRAIAKEVSEAPATDLSQKLANLRALAYGN